ncbi:hypothetical protein NAMH_1339 [Nautilia profundicola AmH]|uniref:Uncharacterized protein n=1 Tax=Nautilia profundicola (strain ATCC BAA-1463 / DSM 18972 / AmH) TaxID=598659 RepID=B9L5U4_NAUPA|nr:hypothetical protein NAMH_1339 [Nautilia profundicola AmH]
MDTPGFKPGGAAGDCLPGRFDSFPLPPFFIIVSGTIC